MRFYFNVKGKKIESYCFSPIKCELSGQFMIFNFDSTWKKYGMKTAHIKINNMTIKVYFPGNYLILPILPQSKSIKFSLSYGNIKTKEIKLMCEPYRKEKILW